MDPHQRAHASDNREERARAEAALALAAAGDKVAVVSGGDPGVFAMAAAVVEAIEAGPPQWRALPLQVSPGVSAMQGAAARLGAPLGHDFCAISLSDNLKPWAIIARRLKAAAEGDFVIALYNPASKARPNAIVDAFALLRGLKSADTPVALARAVGRPDERIVRTRLADVDTGSHRHGDARADRFERNAFRRAPRPADADADAARLCSAAMSGDPGQGRFEVEDRRAGRTRGHLDHHHRQAERAGGVDLRGWAAAVLGDDDVDPPIVQQAPLVRFAKRAAVEDRPRSAAAGRSPSGASTARIT